MFHTALSRLVPAVTLALLVSLPAAAQTPGGDRQRFNADLGAPVFAPLADWYAPAGPAHATRIVFTPELEALSSLPPPRGATERIIVERGWIERAIELARQDAGTTPQVAATAVGDRRNWNHVLALSPGQRLHVEGFARRSNATGTLVSVTDEELVIRTSSDLRTFQRVNVRRVSEVNERRTFWIIAGAGAAGGTIFALQYSASYQRYCSGGACISLPQQPSVKRTMLNTGIATGVSMPFMWLARHRLIYDPR